jgi:hypothetical protein
MAKRIAMWIGPKRVNPGCKVGTSHLSATELLFVGSGFGCVRISTHIPLAASPNMARPVMRMALNELLRTNDADVPFCSW